MLKAPSRFERITSNQDSFGVLYQVMTKASPIVKWAGGKRQLLSEIRRRLPKKIETYYEPFVGGGAVFFALANRKAFKKAVLNDMNSELVDTYRVLSDGRTEEVIELLKTYPYDPDFYNEIRARSIGLSQVERVARFLYLNKTGFNGLYRVNSKGGFNVPFGKYTNPNIVNAGGLLEAAKVLQGVTLECQDFSLSVANAQKGDVVYFDPPYLPKSDTANFTAYTEGGFGLPEHEKLAALFRELAARGVSVLLSNADVPVTRQLYRGFRVSRVQSKRNINSSGEKRGLVGEILVGVNL